MSHVSHHNVRVLRFCPFEPDTFLSAGRDSVRTYRLKGGSLRGLSVRLEVRRRSCAVATEGMRSLHATCGTMLFDSCSKPATPTLAGATVSRFVFRHNQALPAAHATYFSCGCAPSISAHNKLPNTALFCLLQPPVNKKGQVVGTATAAVASGPKIFTDLGCEAGSAALQLPTQHVFAATASGAVFQIDYARCVKGRSAKLSLIRMCFSCAQLVPVVPLRHHHLSWYTQRLSRAFVLSTAFSSCKCQRNPPECRRLAHACKLTKPVHIKLLGALRLALLALSSQALRGGCVPAACGRHQRARNRRGLRRHRLR